MAGNNDGALIEAFLEMMAAERGAARNTLEAYRRDLNEAAAFLRKNRSRFAYAGQRLVGNFVASL